MTGQDQSRTIKGALCGLVPSLRVWLDVDDMRSKAGTVAATLSTRDCNRMYQRAVTVLLQAAAARLQAIAVGRLHVTWLSPLPQAGTKATNTANFGAVIDTTETMIAFLSGSSSDQKRRHSVSTKHLGTTKGPLGDSGKIMPTSAQGLERSDYFLSPPCQQELRRAVSTKTPIVWVYETDPVHGGIAMETHLADCPEDLRPLLEASIAAQEVIDWHRIRSFQDTSLRLILQRVLAVEAEERLADLVYVPTEVTRVPMRLHPPPVPYKYHVWFSEHNPGAAELVEELDKWLVRCSPRCSLRCGLIYYTPAPHPCTTPLHHTPAPTPLHHTLHHAAHNTP